MDDLEAQARADEKAGHARTAGQQYRRAANYLLHAERMQRGHAPERMAVYQRCLDLLARSMNLADPATSRVEVPDEGTSLPAYFRDASSGGCGGGGRTGPCIILWNGLDSSKEHMYLSGFADELARRLLRAAGRRLEREGEHPVPHYWEHVLWVWGKQDLDSFIEFAGGINLDGVAGQITVPFLICRGEHDRQIPLAYAHRSYEQAVNSPKRELRIFTPGEGGAEHIGLDHLPHVSAFIADWVTDPFAELPSGE